MVFCTSCILYLRFCSWYLLAVKSWQMILYLSLYVFDSFKDIPLCFHFYSFNYSFELTNCVCILSQEKVKTQHLFVWSWNWSVSYWWAAVSVQSLTVVLYFKEVPLVLIQVQCINCCIVLAGLQPVEENTNEIYSSGLHSVHISNIVKLKCDCRKCVLHLLNSGPHESQWWNLQVVRLNKLKWLNV